MHSVIACKQRFLLDPHQPVYGSWLFTAKNGDIGCTACHLANRGTTFALGLATFKARGGLLRTDKLKRHAEMSSHICAVANLTNCDKCLAVANNMSDASSAPSLSQFEDVLDKRLEGGTIRKIKGVGKHMKLQEMQRCLAEALRMLHQHHCAQSSSFAFHMDGRSPRLTVRLAANQFASEYKDATRYFGAH